MQNQFAITDLEAYAAKFYQGRPLLLTPYGYNTSFLALAPAGAQSNIINIAANADFIITGVHHRSTIANAAQTVSSKQAPLCRLLIVDSGSNEQFTNVAVDLENYSTNDAKNNGLIYPRIVSGRSTLTLTLSNYDAAATYNTDIFLEGVLVRAYSQPVLSQ